MGTLLSMGPMPMSAWGPGKTTKGATSRCGGNIDSSQTTAGGDGSTQLSSESLRAARGPAAAIADGVSASYKWRQLLLHVVDGSSIVLQRAYDVPSCSLSTQTSLGRCQTRSALDDKRSFKR